MDVKTKVKEASPKLLNAWLLFVTVMIISIVFVLYKFVYIKNNEKAQVDKRFRVLSRIGENISDRETALRNVVENGLHEAMDKSDDGFQEETTAEIKDIIETEIKNANKILNIALKKTVQGSRIIPFCSFTLKSDENAEPEEYVIYTDSEDFFGPLNRRDIFDGLIVMREKTKQESGEDTGGSTVVLYYTFPGDIDIPAIAGLRSKDNAMEAGSLKDVVISNKKFKLFVQPIILGKTGKWYVGGLVDGSRFNGEIRGLKSDIVIFSLIIFCFFILAIPLLKLFLMSTFDQLNINDVILTALSITVGMLLLVLLYLFSYQKASDRAAVEEHLKNLAYRLEEEFTSELHRALEQLESYEAKDPEEYRLHADDKFINILSPEKIETSSLFQVPLEEFIPHLYGLFKVVSWLDTAGMQQVEFSTRKNFGRLVNVGHRRYFQDAGNWKFPGNDQLRFMLESITSITSGEKIAAISKKSLRRIKDIYGNTIDLDVLAMTTRLTSVLDTIMPVGYGFCLIDRSGDTWFHSDKERNKEENFIDETGRDSELVSAIQAAQSHHLDTNYQNRNHKCYILPLPNIPLYIITFHDMQYTRSVQVHTIFYALSFTILLLLFNGLLFLAAAYCNYRTSSPRRRFIPFDWLRPGRGKEKIYGHLIYADLAAAILLIVSRLWTRDSETLFLCLSAALFIFAYNYYTAGKDDAKMCTPFNRRGAFTLGLLFIFINVIAFSLADRFMTVLLFQVLLAAGLWVLHHYKNRLNGKKEKRAQDLKGLEKRYALFLLSWLIAGFAVPFILLYIDAYNLENETALKYLQVNLARDIEKRNLDIDTFYKEKMTDPRQSRNVEDTRQERKNAGIYAGVVGDTHRTEKRPHPPFTELRRFDRAAYYFRAPFSNLGVEKRNLIFSRSSDFSRVWWKEKDRLYLRYEIEQSLPDSPDGEEIHIVSTSSSFPAPTGFSLLFAIAAALLVCWLTYSLIRYSARRVFGLNVLAAGEGTDLLLQIREALHTNAHLAIYCQTRAGVNDIHNLAGNKFMPKHEPSDETTDLYIPVIAKTFDLTADGEDIETAIEKKGTGKIKRMERMVVKNFDLNEYDVEGNLSKIKSLLNLLRRPGLQVLLPTAVPIPKVMEWYETGKASTDKMKAQYEEITTLLTELQGRFIPLYAPLKGAANPYHTIEDEVKEPHLKQLLLEEFAPSGYFKDIEECLALYHGRLMAGGKTGGKENHEDQIIQKIRELSRYYYDELLRSCTRQEILVLYDIARDTLINVNNMDTIDILLKKGLLVYDGTFRLMNESFRSHIMHVIDISRADQLTAELKTRSKWKSYKAPFFLVSLGLAVFFAFQGNLLSEINALMTAVIGTLAIVSKFSGLLSKGGAGPAS